MLLFPEAAEPLTKETAAADDWLAEGVEGQLAVDVHETDDEIVIRSAIAGVNPEDLEVFVHNDLLTIRGERHHDDDFRSGRLVVSECHWGSFSRTLVLPSEIVADQITAALQNGILTVRLPKLTRSHRIDVIER
ncbi:MAG: Hsp20/alpha crystallin family protein [Patescibacteria group bacterium]|nr:Hsp20/alpha crystallin family protein [Patescibacteria group bacterium]